MMCVSKSGALQPTWMPQQRAESEERRADAKTSFSDEEPSPPAPHVRHVAFCGTSDVEGGLELQGDLQEADGRQKSGRVWIPSFPHELPA